MNWVQHVMVLHAQAAAFDHHSMLCLAAANQELPELKKNCKPKPPQKPPTNTRCSTLRSTQSSCLLFCPQAAHLSMPRPGRPDLQLLLSSIATRINKSII